jgi:hypothetical protein
MGGWKSAAATAIAAAVLACSSDDSSTKDASTNDVTTDMVVGDQSTTDANDGGDAAASNVLATNQMKPTGLAVDSTTIYWANETAGTVVSCPKNGCGTSTPTTLASNLTTVRGVAVDATYVYFDDASGVQRCPLAGCGGNAPTQIMPGNFGVAVGSGNAYSTAFPGNLFVCPVTGCDAGTDIGNAMGMTGVGVDSTYVYFTQWGSQHVSRCALAGCDFDAGFGNAAFHIANNEPNAVSVAPSAPNVYWTVSHYQQVTSTFTGHIASCPIAGCPDAGPTTVIGDPNMEPFGIAIDATYIYWTDYVAGTVNRRTRQ